MPHILKQDPKMHPNLENYPDTAAKEEGQWRVFPFSSLGFWAFRV